MNKLLSFDPELLEIRIERQTQAVSSQNKRLMAPIYQKVKFRSSTDSLFLFTEFPVSQVDVHRSEEEEEMERGKAGPPHGTYIIPVDDITIETNPVSALDASR